MEEHIGKVWHKYISKKAIKSYDEQKVYFQDLKKLNLIKILDFFKKLVYS